MVEKHSLKPNGNLDVGVAVGKIAESDGFKEAMANNFNVERSLASASLRLANLETPHDERPRTPEGDVYEVVGRISEYAQGITGMEHANTLRRDKNRPKLSRRDYVKNQRDFDANKVRVIEFNHSLKHMIESDPSLTLDEVSEFVTTMYGITARPRWQDDEKAWQEHASWFNGHVVEALRGMRTELAAGQIAEYIDDVSFDGEHTTVQDDKVGIDARITLSGEDYPADGVTFGVDLKSDVFSARQAEKNPRHTSVAIVTGVKDSDFKDGSMFLPDARARQLAPGFAKEIHNGYNRHLARQAAQNSQLDLAA